MTNRIPKITVKQEVKEMSHWRNPQLRDIVCLIGGFETKLDEDDNTHIDKPKFYKTLAEAEADLRDNSEQSLPEANKALRQIFHESINGVLVVNISTFTGSDTRTWSRTVTTEKLAAALTSVADIEFDLLYVADTLSDTIIEQIDTDAKARFENKKPYGYVGVCTRANVSAYTTTAAKMGNFCYAMLTQTLTINGTELSAIESGAYLTNLIATLPVGNSLTAKRLPEVTGVGTEYTFGASDMGAVLVGLGYFVVRLLNPLENTYECVNSATNNGLDLYINRCRDYIVNDFALRQFLGEKSNNITLQGIKTECNAILIKFKDDLGVVEGINYSVEKVDSNTANIILNTVEFAGIITDINVFMTIEVV